jgi:predicted O-linked N-acetylglucosamine transferase (SPINDLY family)
MAVSRNEASGTAWQDLAAALWESGSFAEAEAAARKALELDADLERASLIAGFALGRQRRFREASIHFGTVVQKHPRSVAGWQNLGGVLASLGENERAELCYRRALEIDPSASQVRIELANILSLLAKDDEARAELQAAAPGASAGAALRCAQTISPMPESTAQILAEREQFLNEIDRLSKALRPIERLNDGELATNFWLAYHGLNDRELQEKWAGLVLKVCPWLGKSHVKPRRPGSDRIRVGFISGFLKNAHTISKLTMGLMGTLPRERFEVIACDVSASTDPGYLPKFADRVLPCSLRPLEAQRQLADAELDIAFFTDIGMSETTWQIALGRVAPVQCTTWGHPVTSGFPSMDYFISSDLIEPEGAEAHYSEKLIRLSTLPTYYYRPGRWTNKRPSLPPDWHVYLCPQSLFKFHPDFDCAFAEILRRDPAGRLLLIDLNGQFGNRLGDRIKAKFPDVIDRVMFLNRMPTDELMGLMSTCHVMLDTHPFSGGNTSYEAFAFATPIVTLPAEYMRGRVTAGQYQKMGFTECVASSTEDYIAKSVRLAADEEYRMWVRHQIAMHHDALYEDAAATTELASFFEQAHKEARG